MCKLNVDTVMEEKLRAAAESEQKINASPPPQTATRSLRLARLAGACQLTVGFPRSSLLHDAQRKLFLSGLSTVQPVKGNCSLAAPSEIKAEPKAQNSRPAEGGGYFCCVIRHCGQRELSVASAV